MLNGRSSPVLTATRRSNGKGQISTPYNNKTQNGLKDIRHSWLRPRNVRKPNLAQIGSVRASGRLHEMRYLSPLVSPLVRGSLQITVDLHSFISLYIAAYLFNFCWL